MIVGLLAGVFSALVLAGQGSSRAARQCQGSDFSLRQGPSSAALAHFRQTVRLKNVTHTACQMSGWATVVLLAVHGAPLPSHEQRITRDMFGTSPKPKVVVSPGAGASFAIDTAAPATACPTSKAIAVTPPGGHGKQRLVIPVQACKQFSVLPVQPDNKAIHP